MRTLGSATPTPEQALVVDNAAPGFWLIRGAAGSGKTTTALLRLRFLARFWRDRREDLGLPGPVRALVLTFNRTLRGYIDELARQQIQAGPEVDLEVSTFSAWGQGRLGRVVLDPQTRGTRLRQLGASAFPWRDDFLFAEVDYVLGRFLPKEREHYLTVERSGRGPTPQVQRPRRERLLEQVIGPYEEWKRDRGVADWTDLGAELAVTRTGEPYDVVIVDETQDFSANQVRAIVNHLADDFVCTFVRDTTQRIYPNVFTWREVGVEFPAGQSRRLTVNYRNTRQIAAFARPLVEGLEVLEDENLPDFTGCRADGPLPVMLTGRYGLQAQWMMRYLAERVRPDETVGFLHPRGGNWFSELRSQLDAAGHPWVSLTREAEWPEGDERIALSTMHSAKGLEFDHVILLGYDSETVQHGETSDDSLLEGHRRLLAMSVGRARRGVVLGYRPQARSPLVDLLHPTTFQAVAL